MLGKEEALLRDLASSGSSSDAAGIAEALEREHGYVWHPVGSNEANYGLINIGSDAGHALIERVTNAIDAVIEREAAQRAITTQDVVSAGSPREAVELWLGVPG